MSCIWLCQNLVVPHTWSGDTRLARWVKSWAFCWCHLGLRRSGQVFRPTCLRQDISSLEHVCKTQSDLARRYLFCLCPSLLLDSFPSLLVSPTHSDILIRLPSVRWTHSHPQLLSQFVSFFYALPLGWLAPWLPTLNHDSQQSADQVILCLIPSSFVDQFDGLFKVTLE